MKFFQSIATLPKSSSGDIFGNSKNFPEATQVTTSSFAQANLTPVAPTSASLNAVTPKAIAIPQQQVANWSAALNQVLEEPPATFPQRVTLGAMAFCLSFGTWAWYGTIDEVSKAQGKLVPQGETYKVEPVELGQVKHIAIKEGDEVKAGQTLVELDTKLAEQEIARLEQMSQAYQTELTQKQGLREKIILEAKTQEDISRAEISAQLAAIFVAKGKADTFKYLLSQQKTEVKAYLNQQAKLKSLATLSMERLSQLKAEKKSRQQRLQRLQPLAQQGAVSQEYFFQAEQSLREAERQITQSQLQEITNAREHIFQSNQAMRELQSRITYNRGELASALREIQRLEAEFIRKKSEGQRIQLEAEQRIKQLELESAQIAMKIADTENLLAAAQAKLQQKFLKAPVDGVVLSLNIDNSGKVVQAGETIIEIAPQGVPLVVSAFIPNQEAGFIEEGMPVQIKLDAYPYESYGLIPGTVTYISADAKSNSQLGEVYEVKVLLERDYITHNQKQIKFKAGQTATADIMVRRRRILDVWLEPIKKLQQDGIEM